VNHDGTARRLLESRFSRVLAFLNGPAGTDQEGLVREFGRFEDLFDSLPEEAEDLKFYYNHYKSLQEDSQPHNGPVMWLMAYDFKRELEQHGSEVAEAIEGRIADDPGKPCRKALKSMGIPAHPYNVRLFRDAARVKTAGPEMKGRLETAIRDVAERIVYEGKRGSTYFAFDTEGMGADELYQKVIGRHVPRGIRLRGADREVAKLKKAGEFLYSAYRKL
jgi:hypothetical protein